MATTAPTYAEFIAQYPAFALSKPTVINSQLSLSGRLLDPLAWGEFYSDAVGLDAAHNISMMLLMSEDAQSAQQAAAGPVSSVSAAGVSISFESGNTAGRNDTDAWYSKTGYGQMFLRLRNVVISPGMMA